MTERMWSPELLELARQAAERSAAENAKVAAMTPEERKKYIHEWAERMAKASVEAGEYCECCKAKPHSQEGKATV